MSEIILHALPWVILGLLCLYAGSDAGCVSNDLLVRDVIKPTADTGAKHGG